MLNLNVDVLAIVLGFILLYLKSFLDESIKAHTQKVCKDIDTEVDKNLALAYTKNSKGKLEKRNELLQYTLDLNDYKKEIQTAPNSFIKFFVVAILLLLTLYIFSVMLPYIPPTSTTNLTTIQTYNIPANSTTSNTNPYGILALVLLFEGLLMFTFMVNILKLSIELNKYVIGQITLKQIIQKKNK